MSNAKPLITSSQTEVPASPDLETSKPQENDPKAEDPLLEHDEKISPTSKESFSTPSSPSPMKSTFSRMSIDEEKAQAQEQTASKGQAKKQRIQHILDTSQRCTSLALSIIILAVMGHAYATFRANKDVTVGGVAIYPTFMQLWPTYMMITAGAITVVLNGLVVYWRIRGTVKDLKREETYNKFWDYALHGINFVIWLATTTSFRVSKNFGPAADPNVLWGYTCSPTANAMNAAYPDIVKFYVECEVQNVSFWMSVSSIIVEGFAVIAKVLLR